MAVRVNRRYLTGYRRGAQVAAIDPNRHGCAIISSAEKGAGIGIRLRFG